MATGGRRVLSGRVDAHLKPIIVGAIHGLDHLVFEEFRVVLAP
jgi:hypothetical protein